MAEKLQFALKGFLFPMLKLIVDFCIVVRADEFFDQLRFCIKVGLIFPKLGFIFKVAVAESKIFSSKATLPKRLNKKKESIN